MTILQAIERAEKIKREFDRLALEFERETGLQLVITRDKFSNGTRVSFTGETREQG